MSYPWETRSIVIHYKDGTVTRYEYSTKTFLMIAESKNIIKNVEIEDRPLISDVFENETEIKITGDLYKWLEYNHGGQTCPKYAMLSRMTALIRKKKKTSLVVSQHEFDHLPQKLVKLVKK